MTTEPAPAAPRLATLGPLAYEHVTVEIPPLTDEERDALVALVVDNHNMEPWSRGARGYRPILASRRARSVSVHMIERRIERLDAGTVIVSTACLRIAIFERVKLVTDEAQVRRVVAAMPYQWVTAADLEAAKSDWVKTFAQERAWVPTDDVWSTDDTRDVTCEECRRALAREHALARVLRGIDEAAVTAGAV